MNIQVIDKRENPLLGRIEVKFVVTHIKEPTPTREKMKNLLANNFQVPESNVIINYAKTQFGLNQTIGYGKVYNSKEIAEKIELTHILKRNGLLQTDEKKE